MDWPKLLIAVTGRAFEIGGRFPGPTLWAKLGRDAPEDVEVYREGGNVTEGGLVVLDAAKAVIDVPLGFGREGAGAAAGSDDLFDPMGSAALSTSVFRFGSG